MPASEVMHKWKTGKLKSGGKRKVPKGKKGQKQAVAIMKSEERKEAAHGGTYPHFQKGPGMGGKTKKGKAKAKAKR